MKIKPHNPLEVARLTGGATFEPALGWWTQAGEEGHLAHGRAFSSGRYAAYIPTIQKSGEPVDSSVVVALKAAAIELGMTGLTQAAGVWVLSETGELQAETIWIAYAPEGVAVQSDLLAAFALRVKREANQDAVAWEEGGELKFTDFILGTVRREVTSVPQKHNPDRLWVVPMADLETVECRELLLAHGEHVLVTSQPWGASWERLEVEVVAAVEKYRATNPSLDVVGVKLAGKSPAEWSTHTISRYDGKGLCPLEVVAKELEIELGEYHKLACLNLRLRMTGLIEAGLPWGTIDALRLVDRCAQGSTPDDEANAVRAWAAREVVGDLTIVRLPRSRCAAVTDRFYGQYRNLIILGEDDEVNFYGTVDICRALDAEFPGSAPVRWMRLVEGSESFWGGYVPPQEVEAFLRKM